MKLFNIFKKNVSKEVKNNIQKLDKKQLSTVIGGTDEFIIEEPKKKGINAINTN